MSSGPTGPSSGTKTYIQTKLTPQVTVVPSIITQSDQIARYFAKDLESFVQHTHIDLAREFQIPDVYSHNTNDIINMLYADISHMLRDGLITGIHLVLSDDKMDPGSNAYLVRYHVRYTIENPNVPFPSASPGQVTTRGDGLTMPDPKVWRGARFALLIDWSPASKGKRDKIRRPEYWFDWLPREERFDATGTLRYSEGGLEVDSANVLRYESAPPEQQRGMI